jgi:4'-phosphopantetheinyl transferase
MQILFREWDDSVPARRAAASLGSDEVQVWLATAPPDEAGLTAFTRALNPDERERAERFRVSEPRRQFVFGRAVLRQLLGACLNVEPATLAFGHQPHGKPFLSQSALAGNLRFNLSHSGRIVAIALARGREVGVDIESIQRLDDWLLLAGRIFSPRELGELFSLPKPQQREAFFNGWTRKEACLKATGEGLTDDLPAIEVTLAPGKEPKLIGLPAGPEAARRWAIRAIPLPPDFAGAVVFEKNSAAG